MRVVVTSSKEKGLERAKEELYASVDNKTVLFLSGGSTPRPLYETIANEKIIKPAAVALIDERYGEPMHDKSNERMIAETGLLGYFRTHKIPVHLILQQGKSPEECAKDYDEIARNLFFHFPKSVGILGIGADGHTAGIPPRATEASSTTEKNIYQTTNFVVQYDNPHGPFGKRVTLSFSGLRLLDTFIVISFGEEKQHALQQMFAQGPLEEIPSRFFLTDAIAQKSLLITDQKM